MTKQSEKPLHEQVVKAIEHPHARKLLDEQESRAGYIAIHRIDVDDRVSRVGWTPAPQTSISAYAVTRDGVDGFLYSHPLDDYCRYEFYPAWLCHDHGPDHCHYVHPNAERERHNEEALAKAHHEERLWAMRRHRREAEHVERLQQLNDTMKALSMRALGSESALMSDLCEDSLWQARALSLSTLTKRATRLQIEYDRIAEHLEQAPKLTVVDPECQWPVRNLHLRLDCLDSQISAFRSQIDCGFAFGVSQKFSGELHFHVFDPGNPDGASLLEMTMPLRATDPSADIMIDESAFPEGIEFWCAESRQAVATFPEAVRLRTGSERPQAAMSLLTEFLEAEFVFYADPDATSPQSGEGQSDRIPINLSTPADIGRLNHALARVVQGNPDIYANLTEISKCTTLPETPAFSSDFEPN